MLSAATKLLWLSMLLVAGAGGVFLYEHYLSPEIEVRKLRQEKQQLQQIVQRLSTERRVAEVLVTDQKTVDGVVKTTLLFAEYARDGSALPYKNFTVEGKTAHIDAMVIKFDHDFVQKDDPLRGHSIALFVRIYGDHQSPDQAQLIDEPGQIPAIYRDADPKISDFERGLWLNFWKLADDRAYAQSQGVRVANGQGVWGPFEMNRLYTLTIEADGGLNITSEPVKGIYGEAMRRRGA